MGGLLIPVLIHFGVLFFTLDMATDCKLIHFYYTTDQMTYFWITLFFTAGPWIFNNIYLYWDKDLGCHKYLAGLMSLCQVLVIYCIIRNLVLIWRGKTKKLNSSNNTLRIIENFGESMPQLCIQSYIILKTLAKNDFVMDTFSIEVLWDALEEGAETIPNLQLASVVFSLCSVTMGFVIFAFEDSTILYQFVLFVFSLICAGLRVAMVTFVATYEGAKYTWWIPPMLGFFASFCVWLVRRYCFCLPGICAVIEPKVEHHEMTYHPPAYPSESRIPIAMANTSRNPEPLQQRSLGALNVLVWFTNLAFNWYNITGLLINLSLLLSYGFFIFVLEYNSDDEYRRASIALITTLVMTVANLFMMVVYGFCSCIKRCSCCGTCGLKSCCFCKGCYVEETDWLY